LWVGELLSWFEKLVKQPARSALKSKKRTKVLSKVIKVIFDKSIDKPVDGHVQQEFHCLCFARNETLAVMGWLIIFF
jgi:hypothetical protein